MNAKMNELQKTLILVPIVIDSKEEALAIFWRKLVTIGDRV